MSLRNLSTAVFLIAGASILARAGADGYDVRLRRPAQTGLTYHYAAVAEQSQRAIATAGQKVLQDQSSAFRLTLEATVQVLAAGTDGRVTKQSFRIEKSLISRGEISNQLFADGELVIASVEGRQIRLTMNGRPVPTETALPFLSVIVVDGGGPGEDEVFGTRERKKVGESWPVNAEAAVELLRANGSPSTKEDIRGTAMLEGISRVAGTDCLLISGSMHASNATVPLPAGFKTDLGEFQMQFSGKYPITGSLGPLAHYQRKITSVTASGRSGSSGAEVKLDIVQESKLTYEIKVER